MTKGREVEYVRGRRITALSRVAVAGGVGLIIGAAAALVVPWQVATLVAWDTAAAVFGGWVWVAVHDADARTTEGLATREDDSRAAADLVLIAASVASLPGVGLALLKASDEAGAAEALITLLAVVTVVVSWLAVHTVFMLRYAHLYYLVGGGIDFHDDTPPDYGDFAYVAFTLGMTYQVSDTDFTSRRLRIVAIRHALLSYVFGIAVIATTINVIASLLGR